MFWGLGLQFVLGLFVIRTEPGFVAFQWLGDQIQVCMLGPASGELGRGHLIQGDRCEGHRDSSEPERLGPRICDENRGLARGLQGPPAQGTPVILVLSESGSGDGMDSQMVKFLGYADARSCDPLCISVAWDVNKLKLLTKETFQNYPLGI